MLSPRRHFACFTLAASLFTGLAQAWELAGDKTIALHGRDGQVVPLGTVSFFPGGGRVSFSLHLDSPRFKDFFLSMKEFKCIEAPVEIQCHVPYPYANPGTVTPDDFAWLEHALLFFYKTPREFGARLGNGLYYHLRMTERGLVGTPQAVDLDLIGVPPENPTAPPFGSAERSDIGPDSRWFGRLIIE